MLFCSDWGYCIVLFWVRLLHYVFNAEGGGLWRGFAISWICSLHRTVDMSYIVAFYMAYGLSAPHPTPLIFNPLLQAKRTSKPKPHAAMITLWLLATEQKHGQQPHRKPTCSAVLYQLVEAMTSFCRSSAWYISCCHANVTFSAMARTSSEL